MIHCPLWGQSAIRLGSTDRQRAQSEKNKEETKEGSTKKNRESSLNMVDRKKSARKIQFVCYRDCSLSKIE